MRVRILVVSALALVGLACPGPNNTVDAGAGGGTGGGFVSGAGGGSGGGTGGSVTVDQYCDGIAGAICDEYIACNRAEASWKTDCIALFSSYFCRGLRQSVQSGEQSFDGNRAAACLAALQTGGATCNGFSTLYTNSDCDNATTGLVPSGGQCDEYGDCANGYCSLKQDAGSQCDGKCTGGGSSAGGLNEPCYGPNIFSCDTPYWCDVAANTCRSPQGTGSSCTNTLMCNADNYCNTSTSQCTALPGAGQPCNLAAYPYCNSSSYCSGSQCVAKLNAGASCTSTGQCASGLVCSQNQCRTRVAEGGACTDGECQTDLICDSITKTCSKYGSVDAGAPCSQTRYCNGSWCSGMKANPDGGVGTAGTCTASYVGYPCSSHASCQSGTYCNGADAGVSGACAAASASTPCSYDQNCRADDYCRESTRLCATPAGPGASCEPSESESCQPAYACIAASRDAGTGQCGIPGSAGTPCFVDGIAQCKVPNDCINGSCTPTGKSGQPCFSEGVCFDGLCNGYNPDAGVRGTCGGKGADGQSCEQSFQCTSGFCDNVTGRCASVCQ